MEHLRGYPVFERTFDLGGRAFTLLGPANFDDLLDDPRVVERFARDEYLPYWAEFWPACLLLADEVARWPMAGGAGARPTVLEFGCGLGLVGLVALSRGWRVVMSDYEDDALAFVRASAARNGLPAPETRFVDWREEYSDLRFERIIAAEVLYETRSLAPIARFIACHLLPDGEATISDFNRRPADGFPDAAQAAGLRVDVSAVERPGLAAGQTIAGRLFRIAHKVNVDG